MLLIVDIHEQSNNDLYCETGQQLNVTIAPLHSIYYIGPPLTYIQLAYKVIPTTVEYMKFNVSTNIKHHTDTFPRNIEIDVTQQPVAIQLSVKKFAGYTDSCKYGGIRMYHRLSMAVHPEYLTQRFVTAHVPYDSYEHSQNKIELNRQDEYIQACTNDSIIFKKMFHLDFGTTNIVFYGYSSMFEIDLNLTVYPSNYISAFNFEIHYCGKSIYIYVYKSFIINCWLPTIQLTQQIKFNLQWPGGRVTTFDYTELLWPGIMDIAVDNNCLSYKAVVYRREMVRECIISDNLRITGLYKDTIITLLANGNDNHYFVPDTESLMIKRRQDECNWISTVQYSVFLDPVYRDNRCPKTQTNFTSAPKERYRMLTKSCVLMDLIFPYRAHMLYVTGAYNRYPTRNTWIYFYVSINKRCFRSTDILVYYSVANLMRQTVEHFQFTPGQSQFLFYDYGLLRKFQFLLRRRSLLCTTFFQMTEVTSHQYILVFFNFFKVCSEVPGVNWEHMKRYN